MASTLKVDTLQGQSVAGTSVTITGGTINSTPVGATTVSTGAFSSVSATTTLKSSGATSGIGYATGAGGSVTQLTSRTTGVTLNTICGSITTHTASLAAEDKATFTVTNSAVAIGDVIVTAQRSGSNGGMTQVEVVAVAAGSCDIKVLNNNAAAGTAETVAIIINFAVIKVVTA